MQPNEATNTGARAYRVLAICDDESTCGFCGRVDLQRVVAFEQIETGEILYAGTTCAQTVKLIVLDEETGELAPRKAREILKLAERKARESKLAAALELAGWQVVVMLEGYRTSEYAGELISENMTAWCGRGGYTLAAKIGGVIIPRSGNRNRFAINLVCGYLGRLARIEGMSQLARREELAEQLLAWIESFRLSVAARIAAGGPVL